MASLYIANTSKQNHIFIYREFESQQLRERPIPIGSQICLVDDAPISEIEYIVKQHAHFGLTKASELIGRRGFVGMCYSIDAPVNVDRMFERLETNDSALNDRSEEQRNNTVAAIANGLQERMQEHGVKVPRTEVEVVEETKGTPKIAVGTEVVEPGTQPRHGGQRARRLGK
jgi:hypothetical protein